MHLRIHWRLPTILSNNIWYAKVCIFWKCIQYTIHWDQAQTVEQFPSDKINGTKNALFFLSRTPAHHSFSFDLGFFYMSWSTRFVSLKLHVRFSIFDSVPFLLKYIFLFNKMHGLFDLKRHNSVQNENKRKAFHTFADRPLIFKLQQKRLKFNEICMSWSTPKLTWWQIF